MTRIKILDELTANQIAAGEVVERPASVVKELVENAIDAKSTKIEILIEEGGLKSIVIQDNGQGIPAEEVALAFERHATSKIETGKDLFQIRSLGFRGEALPSIASVAKVECISAMDDQGLGMRVLIEGGKIKEKEAVQASKGTKMGVYELFYNTPARLKYMKTVQTELGHISDYIYRMALSYPAISFTFKHHQHVLLQTLGNGDLLQVVAAIYGVSIGRNMIAVQADHLDFEIHGLLSRPEQTRANRGGISFFINGRYIKNYGLNTALLQGYHTLLPVHRFPICALHISMHPSIVDVNVHPSKLEVRFSKERELFGFMSQTVKEALLGHNLIPQVQVKIKEHVDRPVQSTFSFGKKEEIREKPNLDRKASFTEKSDLDTKSLIREQPNTQQPIRNTYREKRAVAYPPVSPLKVYETAIEKEEVRSPSFPTLQWIGQWHGTYLIAFDEERLYLIDQHAAHERVNYELFYEKFGNPLPAVQELLVPLTLELTPDQAQRLPAHLPLFEQFGMILEHFGDATFIVRAMPSWIPQGDELAIIQELIEWIFAEKQVDIAKLREKSAIMCACKASIKANQRLREEEATALFKTLAQCTQPYTCPHGRPILISFSDYELRKMFKRVM